MTVHWIPTAKIEAFIGPESFLLTAALTLVSFLFYRLALREISSKRHMSMRSRFFYLGLSLLGGWLFGFLYLRMKEWDTSDFPWHKVGAYCAVIALALNAIAIVRLAQAYLYLYLFFSNIRTGVPRLIANIFTLVFSCIVAGFIASEIFEIRLAPILATSAIFSVVLGLALQDTLGNFFSGVALQLDRPFGIGDWIEVQTGTQKWMGQVLEITWRATALQGYAEEIISIPNRTFAQSEITVFSVSGRHPRRSQAFRFPLDSDLLKARQVLLQSLEGIPQILNDPPPRVLIIETDESWIMLKIFYTIDDFGAQYRIGDQVIMQTLAAIQRAGLRLAHPTLELISKPDA